MSADPGSDAPTLVFALPLMDVPTTRITAVATPAEPAAPAQPAGRVRNSAVLDPAIPGPRRSLPRMLVGVGAVIVAALVLVALFRPDGPLDPPLDPTAVDGTHQTAVPIPVGSERSAVVPAPVAGVRAEMDLDPPRTTAVRPTKERSAGSRQSVTTTPPTMPDSSDSPTRVPSRAGGVRAEAAAPVTVDSARGHRSLPHPSCDPVGGSGKIHPNGGQPAVTFSPATAMDGRGPAGRTPALLGAK